MYSHLRRVYYHLLKDHRGGSGGRLTANKHQSASYLCLEFQTDVGKSVQEQNKDVLINFSTCINQLFKAKKLNLPDCTLPTKS